MNAMYPNYTLNRPNLFTNPIDSVNDLSDIRLIVDNTRQLASLRDFLNSNTLSKADPTTIYLTYDLNIDYSLSDTWFITTVTFACLDFVILATAIILFVLFKRTKHEHIEFRKHKKKWF